MKYVEENFKGAHIQSLSDEEIRNLKNFLNEQMNIESVECILLMPGYKEIDRRYYDESYCSINLKIIVRKEDKDLERINRSIWALKCFLPFKSYIPTNELDVEIMNVNNFISSSMIIKSWSEKYLVSSYILFDRNGIFEKMQDKLKISQEPWANLCIIDNINELSMEYNKKKVLSLNN